MTSRVISSKSDIDALDVLLRARKLPVTVSIRQGKNKSHDQDRLENLWHREAAEQLRDESPSQKRAYCKLHFGVPIMRGESNEYREKYDLYIRPLPYEQKLALMSEPLDFPVTRAMTTGQKKRYLDDVWAHYTEQGVLLTKPKEDDE